MSTSCLFCFYRVNHLTSSIPVTRTFTKNHYTDSRITIDLHSVQINATSGQAIDVDCEEGVIFWAGHDGRAIFRANYDGTKPRVVLETDSKSVRGLAVDWIARNLYWTDHDRAQIVVASLDGRQRRVIVQNENPATEVGIRSPRLSGDRKKISGIEYIWDLHRVTQFCW